MLLCGDKLPSYTQRVYATLQCGCIGNLWQPDPHVRSILIIDLSTEFVTFDLT